LDTNILSEPLRPQPISSVTERLQHHQQEIATASVVIHEILYGSYRLPVNSNKRQIIQTFLDQEVRNKIPIFSYDITAAEWHATERARLTAVGRTPSFEDGQIAAIAHMNNLILVTSNVSDYANFQNLTIENWFMP
jgi:tRNA(fMet)-specific endonuclease VapC